MTKRNKTVFTTATPDLAVGDEVRVIETGRIGVITDINAKPTGAASDDVYGKLSGDGWRSDFDSPEDVELVRRAEDIPATHVPSLNGLVDTLSSALRSGFDESVGFNTHITGEPDGQFLASILSPAGRGFGCRVTISEIELIDLSLG